MRFDFRTFVLILFSPGQFGNPLDAKPGYPNAIRFGLRVGFEEKACY